LQEFDKRERLETTIGNKNVTCKERVYTVLKGQKADRPPLSFWHHFPPPATRGEEAVRAHLEHLERWKLDFLKVMNDTGFPRPKPNWVITSAENLKQIPEYTGNEKEFEEELQIVRNLAERLRGDPPMVITVFNTWATLRRLCAPESDVHGPPKLDGFDQRDEILQRIRKEDDRALSDALQKIGRALANFSKECLSAGADGIFLSVRDDWLENAKDYDDFVKPNDLSILDAVSSGSFNMLHVCGKPKNFERFTKYPTQAINWADRYAGPRISDAIKVTRQTICGGLDNLNTMPNGTREDCVREIHDALLQAGGRPIMITPGCTYDPNAVPKENLQAIVDAVHNI